MSEYNISYSQYKKYYLPQRIGPGALGNNQVEMCQVCSQNDWPHEAVVYRDGRILNYYTGEEHVHKEVFDDPRAWTALGWRTT